MNNTPAIPKSPSNDDIAALRAIVEGTAHDTGEAFLQSLVRHLATAVGTRYAFVAEFAGGTRARTLAFWFRDRITDNIEWDVAGTPCEDVVRGNLCHHPFGVRVEFPDDKLLVDWGIESYLGVPLRNAKGEHLGHLAVFDEQPLPAESRKLFALRICARARQRNWSDCATKRQSSSGKSATGTFLTKPRSATSRKTWIRASSLPTGRRFGCWGSNPTRWPAR